MPIMTSNSSIVGEESSSSFTWSCYQVFICFRGPDVRRNFLECFRDKLESSRIDAFTDKEGIRLAEEINPKLATIISHAQVCIPIFSKDFASSKSCLMEVERMLAFNKTILPIFYGVKPCVVRYQQDSYGESFRKHIGEPDHTVNLWKSALEKASWKIGEELSDIAQGYHGLITRVVDRLWELLRMDSQYLPKHLVGIGHHVREVLRKLDIVHKNGEVVLGQELSGRRVVVILGQPGIGKTTLAKAVYNKIRPLYRIRGSSFLDHVRRKEVDEGRLISLQEKLIRDLQGQTCLKIRDSVEGAKLIKKKFHNKAVFIVLDDADTDWKRIEELMGGLDWLGPGSKVVVTTNERDVVSRFRGDGRVVVQHEVGEMPNDKARELFCKHAFRRASPTADFAGITGRIIPLLRGNPGYIEHVGSFLYGIPNDGSRDKLWEEMREKLEAEPAGSMEELLKMIYGKFSQMTRDIFLDIACLFNGMDQRIPYYLWKSCYLDPSWGILDLRNSSWLKVGVNEEMQMPELMVLLGKKMVKDEDRDNPLNRSRVWDHKDASRALEAIRGQGSNKVKALCLEYDSSPCRRFSYHDLCLLSASRVLRLCHAELDGDLSDRPPLKLCWLTWKGCRRASQLLPFDAGDLLVLDLSSNSTSLSTFASQGWHHIQGAKKLKVLNLSGRSVASVIFPLPTSLEQLILERCLIDFSSVNILPNLLSLNIKHCKLVRDFPRALGEMNALTEILIDGADIKEITLPRDLMKRLKVLSARSCKKLLRIPEFLDSSSMQVLSFEGCEQILTLPDSVGKLQHLKQLDLSETMITQLNPSFDRLKKLEILRMRRTHLGEFPRAIQSMTTLKEIDFSDSGSMQGECDATSLSSLRILKLSSTRVSHLRMSRTIYCNLEILEWDGKFFRCCKYQSYAEGLV